MNFFYNYYRINFVLFIYVSVLYIFFHFSFSIIYNFFYFQTNLWSYFHYCWITTVKNRFSTNSHWENISVPNITVCLLIYKVLLATVWQNKQLNFHSIKYIKITFTNINYILVLSSLFYKFYCIFVCSHFLQSWGWINLEWHSFLAGI